MIPVYPLILSRWGGKGAEGGVPTNFVTVGGGGITTGWLVNFNARNARGERGWGRGDSGISRYVTLPEDRILLQRTEDASHTPSIAFRHLPPKYVVNQCLESGGENTWRELSTVSAPPPPQKKKKKKKKNSKHWDTTSFLKRCSESHSEHRFPTPSFKLCREYVVNQCLSLAPRSASYALDLLKTSSKSTQSASVGSHRCRSRRSILNRANLANTPP